MEQPGETLADLAEPHAPEGREDPAARALDHLARLVATALDAPTALVWAAESEERVILGRSGSPDARTMRRLEAFCRQVADRGELVADPDAALAGVPFSVPGRPMSGVVCAAAAATREWTERDVSVLIELARSASAEIGMRQALAGADRERRERAALLDAVGIGVYGVDAEGCCTFINKAAERTLGFDTEEVLGRNMHDLVHHTYPDGSPYPQSECPLIGTLQTGRPVQLDNEMMWRKDGSFFLAEYSSFPIIEDGDVRGSVVTFQDTSQRDDAQRRLAAQIAVGRVLAGSADLETAMAQVLAVIGSEFRWDVGAFWTVDEAAGVLRCAARWTTPDLGTRADEFAAVSEETPLERGQGLPGRVWAEDAPVHLDRLLVDANFPRHEAALRARLRTAFGFPVTGGLETLGVIEFFSRQRLRVDENLLEAASTLGRQIGQFFKRKRAEEALRDSEALKGAVLESALDCIVTIDEQSRVVEFNPAAETTFGYARDAVLGREMPDLMIPPEYRERHCEGLARYLESGEGPILRRRIEMPAMRADGTIFPVELAITPIRAGGKTRFTAYLRDIGARKRAEQALRDREAQFRTLADNIPQLAWMAVPEGAIYWYNKRWYDYTGTAPGETMGWDWRKVHHPDHLERVEERLRACFAAGEPWEDTFPLRGADGGYRWFLSRALPIQDEDGRVVRWFGTNTDVTEQREAEEALAAAKESAEAANHAKSQFLANMSHELRTPLTAVIGYSEMLQEEMEDLGVESLVPDIRKIEANARHLLGLINDVLDLSKIEADRMELYPEAFGAEAMVRDVAATVEALVTKKENELVLDLGDGLGEMHTDQTRLRQCLINLLSNAAKFTKKGRITLGAWREQREERDWLAFSVADTGIGMTREQLDKLFERFTQADVSTTRRFGGTGLGLALTRAFARMLGGDVAVESTFGRGSTFTLHVPANLEEDASEAGAGAEADGETPVDCVLVVDDDSATRELLTRFLTREGFAVRTAGDGRAGLELARTLRPRAILLDVTMPRMDGWAVLRALKADPELAAIPVIMATILDEQNLAFSLGATDYLQKPIEWDRLKEVMERFRGDGPCQGALVVDDDADTRDRLRTLLRKEGWSVTTAENGAVALEEVAKETPCLILLDLMMPEMDGFTFLRQLRARPEWRAIPVVVLTAKDITPEDRRHLDGRADRVIQKGSMSLRDLAGELRRLVADGEPEAGTGRAGR